MTGADKVVCQAATLLLLFTLTTGPARAQFGGFGGAGGGDMMTQMAPMLEMMKAKMGKRRFGMMMQTMGPMMSQMMEGGGGGFGGVLRRGGIPRGPGGGPAFVSGGVRVGGGAVTGVLSCARGRPVVSMNSPLVRIGHLRGPRRDHPAA